MGAPERKAVMESEKMKQSEEGRVEVGESPRDQLSWAQFVHDASYFDTAAFSPRGLFTPRDSLNTFPDLSAICSSPLFAADPLKFLWSPRPLGNAGGVAPVAEPAQPEAAGPVSTGAAPADKHVPAPTSVSNDHHQDVKVASVQSLDLSRVSNSAEPAASSSDTTGCDSEGPCSSSADVKVLTSTAESTAGSRDSKSRVGRKRKSAERDDEDLEHVDNASDPEEIDDSKDKKSRSSSKQQKVKGPKRLREPRYAIKTRTEVDIMEDGYKWRKYGQKPVKNSPHPRNYYRCTTPNCPVRKRVERSTEDPGLVVTSYEGTHTHPKVNQPKRTASGNFAPVEAAESLSESLNQLQNRQQAAASASSQLPQVPNLFAGFPGSWPSSLMSNRQPPPVPAASSGAGAMPSLQDNVGLMLAYQIVKLQWELQAKIQQFISYNAQGGFGAGLPKVNPFMDPFTGFLQGQGLTMPDLGMMSSGCFGGSSDSDHAEMDQRLKALPKVPEALSSGSGSLLARRAAAAQRAGSPLNPNLQSNALKMQQFMAQMMAGLQQQASLEQQGAAHLGEGQSDPSGQ